MLSKMLPFVSVIMPTYNRAHVLRRAIMSVLGQTYENLELIIVDDCSRDNTKEIVHYFTDERIVFVSRENNKGAAAARNLGIRLSKGRYLAFIDSDDEWMECKLETQLAVLDDDFDDLGAVYAGLFYATNGRKKVGSLIPKVRGNLSREILRRNVVGPLSTVLARKEAVVKAGLFDEKLPSCQDWDLYIRLALQYRFDYLKECLVYHYIDNSRITSNINVKVIGHRLVLDKYFDHIKRDNKGHAEQRFILGQLLLLSERSAEGALEFFRSLLLHPVKLRYYIHFLCSLLGCRNYKKIVEIKGKLRSALRRDIS